jgi:hypothetical protein
LPLSGVRVRRSHFQVVYLRPPFCASLDQAPWWPAEAAADLPG